MKTFIERYKDLSDFESGLVSYELFKPGATPNKIVINATPIGQGRFSPSPILEDDQQAALQSGVAKTQTDGGMYSGAGSEVAHITEESALITWATANGYDLIKHQEDSFYFLNMVHAANATLTDNTGDYDINPATLFAFGIDEYVEVRIFDIVTGETTPILTNNDPSYDRSTPVFSAVNLAQWLTGSNANWRIEMFTISDFGEKSYKADINPTIN